MHRLNELAAKLSPAEVKDVEHFAEALVARRASSAAISNRPNRIRLEELDSLLTRLTDDTPWPETKKQLRNEWADAAED